MKLHKLKFKLQDRNKLLSNNLDFIFISWSIYLPCVKIKNKKNQVLKLTHANH